jgi:lysozyme
MLFGVDVSEYQVRPNWSQAYRSGLAFAFARASYGAHHPDPYYDYNKAAIPTAGLVPGAYHYLTATRDAPLQADVFCQLADPNAIHALDAENIGLDVSGWVSHYRTHYPTKPLVIYTRRNIWAAASGDLNGGELGPLWVSAYPSTQAGPLADLWLLAQHWNLGLPWYGWNAWDFWQFTETAQVPGVNTPVDGDVFAGTIQDLQALAGVEMPLTDADLAKISTLMDQRISAALPAIAQVVQNFYQVHEPNTSATEGLDAAVGEILALISGLTPHAVAMVVQAALPAGPIDVATLAQAISAQVDIRQQVRDVLLHGAQG